jgi:hypothetical protein
MDRLAFPYLDPALVPNGALEQMRELGSALPAAITDDVFFEFRLLEGCDQVDMVLHVTRRGCAILAGSDPWVRLDPAIARTEVWRRVQALCAQWADPTTRLSGLMNGMWLEFDLDHAARLNDLPVPAPGVFVQFHRLGTPGDAAVNLSAAVAALAPLHDGPLPARTAETMLRCFEALPEPSYLDYVGWFPRRGSDAVRLCVRDLPDEVLPDFLARVGWPGDVGELARSLARVSEHGAEGTAPISGYLHLDVGDMVLPRLCREYAFERRAQMEGAFPEQAFMNRLVDRGLCSEAKRDGLLRWPGYQTTALDHELWQSLVMRRLNHVKLVFDVDRSVQAKGYVALNHRFREQPRPAPASRAASERAHPANPSS